MAFRTCQCFSVPVFSPVFVQQQIKDDSTGAITFKALCSKDSRLPDSDLFELENLLAAKVPLQQVNSKLVGGATIDLNKVADNKQTNEVVNDKQTNEVVNDKQTNT